MQQSSLWDGTILLLPHLHMTLVVGGPLNRTNTDKGCTLGTGYPLKFIYTTLTNLSTKYLLLCKVYTDVGGIK